MRAYLAILKDSFREALASRVLWIVLMLIAVVLLALSPVGVYELPGGQLESTDFKDYRGFCTRLKQGADSDTPSPGKHIWSLLPDDVKEQVTKLSEEKPSASFPISLTFRLRDSLNQLLAREDFYDAAAWKGVSLGNVQQLLQRRHDGTDDDAIRRANRAALAAAFPDEIVPSQVTFPVFYYLSQSWSTLAASKMGPPENRGSSPLKHVKRETFINTFLAFLIEMLLGIVGVFVGILVTASIIPNTFEAGSIDLLFSKPVSRIFVFLTKFVGGCAFVLLSAGFFFAGLYLIFGLRLGVWANDLLLCIPVYLFLFSIYYSVSALVGVLYRNAIVSVIVTILFWCMCLSVRTTNGWVYLKLESRHFISCLTVKHEHFAADEFGQIFRWQNGDWESVAAAKSMRRDEPHSIGMGGAIVGPIYDSKDDQIVAMQTGFGGLGLIGTALVLAKPDSESGNWEPSTHGSMPPNASALLVDAKGPLIVAARGIFRYTGKAEQTVGDRLKAWGAILGAPAANAIPDFELVSDGLDLSLPFAAAIDPQTGDIALADKRELRLLSPDVKGVFHEKQHVKTPGDKPGLLAYSGATLVLATVDGMVRLISPKDLSVLRKLTLPGAEAPRFAEISDDGRLIGLVLRNRRLWLYDTKKQQEVGWWIYGQGDISAVSLSSGELSVIDQFNRLTTYDPETITPTQSFQPPADFLELFYRYGIGPIHAILPQPGELDRMTEYLISGGRKDHDPNSISSDPRLGGESFSVWDPVRNNLLFIAVVLGIGSWYIHRKDF